MLLKKQGMPEEEELVLCTVTRIQIHSVFVVLDEYERSGMIHISEVSPGRIRNIRDFVKEDKKVVCKVLRIHQDKGHIDLSLRRVTEAQRRNKIDEIKQQQKAEKIIEFVARDLKTEVKKFFDDISLAATKKYSSIYEFFQAVSQGNTSIADLKLEPKAAKLLEDSIKSRISEKILTIEGTLKLTTYAPNGIQVIQQALQKAQAVDSEHISIKYLGSGSYHFLVKAKDFKQAEKLLKNAHDSAITFVSKHDGTGSFERKGT